MQNRHDIAYESHKLRGPDFLYTIYDKEMLSIMHALAKFRKYLVGAKFVVKTNHNILKYFLERRTLMRNNKSGCVRFMIMTLT
jgi:hypothetical protein